MTIGQLLGMAAHLEGRGVSVLDMAGLAQKGGAVHSHIQIAAQADTLYATRIAMGEADLLLGCDLVVSAGAEVLGKFQRGRTHALLNTAQAPTAAMLHERDWRFPAADLLRQVLDSVAEDGDCACLDAQSLATALLGDALYANPLMLGAAWQRGWIPLRLESLLRAIELNGVAVDANRRAFDWGRAAAHDPLAVQQLIGGHKAAAAPASALSDIVAIRAAFLKSYQDTALAVRYARLVERVARAESAAIPDARLPAGGQGGALARAVAHNYFRLLAVKDEYEVARLQRDPGFRAGIRAQFSGRYRLHYHLAPPLLARRDPVTGLPRKRHFGPWLGVVFALLAPLRFLRGTVFDPFGHTAERRLERALAREYEGLVEEILTGLAPERLELALELARFPEEIRGYGHVKMHSLERVRPRLTQARQQWRAWQRNATAQ